jgi:chemotaxis protein MotB
MKTKNLIVCASLALILASCVSKKKYTELENKYQNTTSELQKQRVENEELEDRMERINMRVERYNNKIASLQTEKDGMMVSTQDGKMVLSENNKKAMRRTLKNVPAARLAGATTLKDSLNIAIAYNISKKMGRDDNDDSLKMSIEDTVIMINIDDDLLFKDGSYKVGKDADEILQKIADVVKSEPSLEILVEGHTDDRTIKEGGYLIDNWDLSTRRSAEIVRRLENKFGVSPDQLIVAGRSSYDPIVANDSKENMAKNRRTQIIIMPNLDKFFAMLDESATPLKSTDK